MNLFQLVFKQMRQRALGTWLTLLSVLLGVALAVAILLMRGAGSALFGQTEYGYDVLVGIGQGSPLQLTLNTVYHIDVSPGNVPYWVYETLDGQDRPPRGSSGEFSYNGHVKSAVPVAVGDTYKGRPIVGSPPKLFVSLTPLRDQIDALRDRQTALLNDVQAAQADPTKLGDGLAKRQAALKPELQKVRDEIKRIAQETTPLIELPDPFAEHDAESAKWHYGKPVTFRADAALSESDAAEAALGAKDAKGAEGHLQTVLKSLDVIYKAAGAENGPLEYRPDESYELAEGRIYHAWKFESVIGSEVAQHAGLKMGSTFKATHGNPGPNEKPDVHPQVWEVVGVMKPTHTAADRCVYIPLLSFYCIAEHEKGLKAQEDIREGKSGAAAKTPPPPPPPAAAAGGAADDDDGPAPFSFVYGDELDPDLPHTKDFISLETPKKDWAVSAILVKSRGGVKADDLMYFIKNDGMKANIQAVNPARVMREFFDTFFKGSTTILLVIALLVSVVAAMGILVSIYNSVSARNREIAILRALGATRARILTVICVEAGLIGLFGGIAGIGVGHLFGAVASEYMRTSLGQGFKWFIVDVPELLYLGLVVAIALAAGLVPALKAYRTPVATNLVAA
jgi:putative ABC transport system permease protein